VKNNQTAKRFRPRAGSAYGAWLAAGERGGLDRRSPQPRSTADASRQPDASRQFRAQVGEELPRAQSAKLPVVPQN
jgi:hypothetical protein